MSTRRARLPIHCALGALCMFAFPESVRAAEDTEHPPIHLALHPCVPVEEAAVRQVLALELGALLTEGDAPASGVTQVTVDCADAQIWLRVDDPVTGKSLLRRIYLLTVNPGVRARLLGLAIAELVNASWTELLANPKPVVPAADPIASPEIRRAALSVVKRNAAGMMQRPAAPGWGPSLFGVIMLSGFFASRTLLTGGGVRLGWSHRRHFGWAVDLIAQHGSSATPLGDVALDAVSSGASLFFDHHGSRLGLRLGGGFRGGLLVLSGRPKDPTEVQGNSVPAGWGGPTLSISTSVKLPKRVLLQANLEGGYVSFPVLARVAWSSTVGLDGLWLGAQAGIGFLP